MSFLSSRLRCKFLIIFSEEWLFHWEALVLKEQIQGMKVLLPVPSCRRKKFGLAMMAAGYQGTQCPFSPKSLSFGDHWKGARSFAGVFEPRLCCPESHKLQLYLSWSEQVRWKLCLCFLLQWVESSWEVSGHINPSWASLGGLPQINSLVGIHRPRHGSWMISRRTTAP